MSPPLLASANGNRNGRRGRSLDVALVYPPFGPSGLPSLGLALLSAGVKSRGHRCRAFHWNLDVLVQLPGDDRREQSEAYHELSGRLWFPFNEWIFAAELNGGTPDDGATVESLLTADAALPGKRLNA